MLLPHVSAPTGHLQGGNLQRNICITNTVQDVHVLCYNIMLLINKFAENVQTNSMNMDKYAIQWIWLHQRKEARVRRVQRIFTSLSVSTEIIWLTNKTLTNKTPSWTIVWYSNTTRTRANACFNTATSMDAVRSTTWFTLIWTSANCPGWLCVVCPFVQFRYRSSTVVCKEMQLQILIDNF